MRSRIRRHSLVLAAFLVGGAAAAVAEPPPEEGDCPTVSGARVTDADGAARDAAPIALREGMVLTIQDLLILRQLVPKEIWSQRGIFFHEGMRMEIGPCHRRYPVPGFYRKATERFAGQAKLDARGNLEGYTAGLPFPPATIDLADKDAAVRWAWNLELRYRGAGHRGHFRIVDFPSRLGSEQTYEGEFFLLPVSGRSDLPEQDYRLAAGRNNDWIFGGHFTKPFAVRHIAWRQFRNRLARSRANEADDTFVYVPTMRKSRRASTVWVDGFYLPTYTVAGDSGGGPMPIGTEGATINPTASRSAAVTENAYKGFEGLSLRPNGYLWRNHGTTEVLAPINAVRGGFPNERARNFGSSGLSVASDRWEVRQAVVIEGAMRRQDEAVSSVTYLVDYQTQQPLYRFTRAGKRRLLDIQIFVHRFSGDQIRYPEWPGGLPPQVFDPVAQVSYDVIEGGGGWRRESHDIVSTPFNEDDLTGLISAAALDRGR
jgi:hypothetical protein